MAIWGPTAKFNSCQYFQLYGKWSQEKSEIVVKKWLEWCSISTCNCHVSPTAFAPKFLIDWCKFCWQLYYIISHRNQYKIHFSCKAVSRHSVCDTCMGLSHAMHIQKGPLTEQPKWGLEFENEWHCSCSIAIIIIDYCVLSLTHTHKTTSGCLDPTWNLTQLMWRDKTI